MPASNLPAYPRRIFLGAGIYGILALLPMYLAETGLVPLLPAPLTRPSDFYGFVGVALVWQAVFLLIASDVRRFRPLMLLGVFEKLVFAVPVMLLFRAGRIGADVLFFGTIDLILAFLFIAAYQGTPAAEER